MFDAWLNRNMSIKNRALAVIRARYFLYFWRIHIQDLSSHFPDLFLTARSFISPASFHIFNRLCDTLLILILVYARYYPNQPFCPWLLGTEFVEHFFGLARMLLPNFTFAEFLKLVQHVMIRQRILLSGDFREGRERNSAAGYHLDFDSTPLTSEDQMLNTVGRMLDSDLNILVEIGFDEARKICTQILKINAAPIGKGLRLVPLGHSRRKVPTRQ